MSSWYSQLFSWSLLTFVTVMLNAVVFSVVGDSSDFISRWAMCSKGTDQDVSEAPFSFHIETEGKIIFVCDWFSLAAFLFRK